MARTGFDRGLVVRTLRGLEHQGHLLIKTTGRRDAVTGRGPAPRVRVRDAAALHEAAVSFWRWRRHSCPLGVPAWIIQEESHR